MVGNIPTRAVSTIFSVPSELYVPQSDIEWDWNELPSLQIGRVSEVVHEGHISMVSPVNWDTWNQEYIYPDGSPGREIKLQGNIAIDDLRLTARLMIDTGCQVSIVFRKGLIEGKYLQRAPQPISILTASGSNLTGGQKGCYLSVVIPLRDEATGSTRMVHCAPSWAYEGAIKGNDLIIGYPFLKTFRFIIDCSSDTLLRGDSPLDSSMSISTSKPRASAMRKMRGVQKDCTWEEAGDQGTNATMLPGDPDRVPQCRLSNSQQTPSGHKSNPLRPDQSSEVRKTYPVPTLIPTTTPPYLCGDDGLDETFRSLYEPSKTEAAVSKSGKEQLFTCGSYGPQKDAKKTPVPREGVKSMAKKPAGSRPKTYGSENQKRNLDTMPANKGGSPPSVLSSPKEQTKGVANASLHGNAQHKSSCSHEQWKPDISDHRKSVDVPMNMDQEPHHGRCKIFQIVGSSESIYKYYCESCQRKCVDSDADCSLNGTGLIPIQWVQKLSEEVSVSQRATEPTEVSEMPSAPEPRKVFTFGSRRPSDVQSKPLEEDFADMCLNNLKGHSDFSNRFIRKNTLAVLREVDPEFFVVDEKRLEYRTVKGCKICRLNSLGCSDSSITESQHAQSQRELHKSEFSFGPKLVTNILCTAKSHGLYPTVDAFASHTNHILRKYWWKHTCAFSKDWTHEILWCNPPHALIPRVVTKILKEQSRGIFLVPYKPNELWFHALARITTFWWDLPFSTLYLYDEWGKPFKSSTRFRVIFFNAYMALNRCDNDNVLKSMLQPLYSKSGNAIEHVIHSLCKYPEDVRHFNVIQVGTSSAHADDLIQKIKTSYKDVLEQPLYAKDIDPASRGPFGMAKIELKEGATPSKNRFYRANGDREVALDELISSMLKKGWIFSSKSAWAAQAF